MEKLIISKQLADEVKKYKGSIARGIDNIQRPFKEELKSLREEHRFLTNTAVSAYLLGGQERVYEVKIYEVKKEPWRVVWLTVLEKFYAFEGDENDDSDVYQVLIRVCDTEKEAKKQAEQLNHTLDVY